MSVAWPEAVPRAAPPLFGIVETVESEDLRTLGERGVEDGSAAATRLMGAKRLEGAVQLRADCAGSAVEGFVAQAGRMGWLTMAVGQDAARPFEAVMTEAARPADPGAGLPAHVRSRRQARPRRALSRLGAPWTQRGRRGTAPASPAGAAPFVSVTGLSRMTKRLSETPGGAGIGIVH